MNMQMEKAVLRRLRKANKIVQATRRLSTLVQASERYLAALRALRTLGAFPTRK